MTMRATLICSIDAYANGVKPRELRNFFIEKGYEVDMFDTHKFSRLGASGLRRLLPALRKDCVRLYLVDAILAVCSLSKNKAFIRCANSILLLQVVKLRGRIVARRVRTLHSDVVICENNFDQGFVLYDRAARLQILDLPAPFAEELYYGMVLSKRAYQRFRDFEIKTYAAADKLSFHWHTYAEYVTENKFAGDNALALTYGVYPKQITASYSSKPRILFLGLLSGYWVNLPLLSSLCRLYDNLDVYGGPKPPAHYGIRYKGYAPSLDVMAEYQFGLTTITSDELRRHSFSSKHLEYISYGLPVLTPAWRPDSALDTSSIYYTADNFASQIKKYSCQKEWQLKHRAALHEAALHDWETALSPLAELLVHPTTPGDRRSRSTPPSSNRLTS